MTILEQRSIALGMIFFAAIGLMANAYPGWSSSATEGVTGSQDVRSLDRRISSLEQRLYSIETSISRLQQSATSQRPPVSQPNSSEHEINLLGEEIRLLHRRLNEIDCGLIKLDERTTTSAVREARRNTEIKTADPCRLHPAAPLRLSTRP